MRGNSKCRGGDLRKRIMNYRKVKNSVWLAQKVICGEKKDMRQKKKVKVQAVRALVSPVKEFGFHFVATGS